MKTTRMEGASRVGMTNPPPLAIQSAWSASWRARAGDATLRAGNKSAPLCRSPTINLDFISKFFSLSASCDVHEKGITMAWDNEAHPAITLARLKVMPPQAVYAELRDYGDYMRSDVLSWPDAALEDALLARDEPLINIGLAKYGGSDAVANTLYQRALAGSSDPHYDKGLRLACLSNQVDSRALLKECFGKVNLAELRRLAHDGDWDDISVLLRNPSARGALDLLYNRRPPFADIPDDRLCDLVRASIHNPRLNFDESNEHGRVENRLSPALPHQTVHAVRPHTAFRCSSCQGMRRAPARDCWNFV